MNQQSIPIPKLNFSQLFDELDFIKFFERISLISKLYIQIHERIDITEDIEDILLNLSHDQIINILDNIFLILDKNISYLNNVPDDSLCERFSILNLTNLAKDITKNLPFLNGKPLKKIKILVMKVLLKDDNDFIFSIAKQLPSYNGETLFLLQYIPKNDASKYLINTIITDEDAHRALLQADKIILKKFPELFPKSDEVLQMQKSKKKNKS